MPKLKLLVDSYDSPPKKAGGNPIPRSKDEIFDATPEEADRLTNLDPPAALDPKKAQAEEQRKLEERRVALEAERAALDDQLATLNPSKLTGDDLDQALRDRGLSVEGKADEKRARLAAAIADEQG